jgi:hypothetical protein
MVAKNTGGGTFSVDSAVDSSSGTMFFTADVNRDGMPDVVSVQNFGLAVLRGGCAPSPLRLSVSPAVIHANDHPTLTVNAVSYSDSLSGQITVREGSSIIATKTITSGPLADTSFSLGVLTPGAHTFSVTSSDQFLGSAEASITVNVLPSVSRRRAVHH